MTNLVKKLSGHSGCEILLVKYGENYAVRKKSGSKDYNARLRTQCAKQMATPGVGVFSPKVIRTFTEDGLFGFEMEYVEGMTLAEYLGGMTASEIRGFIKSFLEALHLD